MAGARRKVRNLNGGRETAVILNFGGKSTELWCPGGEIDFVRRMIAESVVSPGVCGWFTTLLSKGEHLPLIERALEQARVTERRVVPMAQGQKQSRIVAWRF
jgi:23S rRNA (adenine1618-N6)-methyltransferase